MNVVVVARDHARRRALIQRVEEAGWTVRADVPTEAALSPEDLDGVAGGLRHQGAVARYAAARTWDESELPGLIEAAAGRALPVGVERWLGVAGQATTLNGVRVATRACPDLSHAALATTGPHYFTQDQGDVFMQLAQATDHRRMIMGGDCYNYAMLASGHLDVVCEAGLKLHDFAALVPVVEGAGGTMCDWNGEPLHASSEGHVLALGDPARLDDVLEAMGGAHPHAH